MKGKMATLSVLVFLECQSANHWAMSFVVLGSLPMLLSPFYRGPGGSVRPQVTKLLHDRTVMRCRSSDIIYVFNT